MKRWLTRENYELVKLIELRKINKNLAVIQAIRSFTQEFSIVLIQETVAVRKA